MRLRLLGLFLPFAFLLAGSASAVPITMSPGSVSIDTVFGMGNSFTLTYDGGDTSDNVLDFTVQGGGGHGFMNFLPSTALAAIVFDGTSIIDAGDTIGGTLNPANVVRGLTLPGGGAAAALLVDALDPTAESFYLQLASTPTTATLYSLNVGNLTAADIKQLDDILKNAIDKQHLRFSAAIPEPGSALVFAVGLLVTRGAIRRRR